MNAHPKNNATILVAGEKVGHIAVAVGKFETAVAEINLEKLIDFNPEIVFSNPTKFQKSHLDFTFEWDAPEQKTGTPRCFGMVEEIFEKFHHPLNMGFRLKDIYENKYTLEFTVGSFEKTLTGDDINEIWTKIIAHGKKNGLTLKE
jgi:phenylalanyl-tRNA synthetase beta subunit